MPGAGSLRERVRFESPTPQDDDYGNSVEGWTDEFTVAAQIKPLKGGENVMAARLGGVQPVVIIVRSSSQTRQISTDWRVVDARKGTVFNVRSIANMDERNRFLDIIAQAGVA